jgi:DNA-binding transcriptional ArsR family regulator
VLQAVAARGGATATELADTLPVSRQAIVKHLSILERTALVHHTKRGRDVVYEVDLQRLRDAGRALEEIASRWEHRLSLLKRMAESEW